MKMSVSKNVLSLLTKMFVLTIRQHPLLLFSFLGSLTEKHALCSARLLLSVLDTSIAYRRIVD